MNTECNAEIQEKYTIRESFAFLTPSGFSNQPYHGIALPEIERGTLFKNPYSPHFYIKVPVHKSLFVILFCTFMQIAATSTTKTLPVPYLETFPRIETHFLFTAWFLNIW